MSVLALNMEVVRTDKEDEEDDKRPDPWSEDEPDFDWFLTFIGLPISPRLDPGREAVVELDCEPLL